MKSGVDFINILSTTFNFQFFLLIAISLVSNFFFQLLQMLKLTTTTKNRSLVGLASNRNISNIENESKFEGDDTL